MEQVVVQPPSAELTILNQIQRVSESMSGWLKFLGIMNIISGALTALSIWGIIIAWLPIWLGVLLLQAANRINAARFTQNKSELVTMMDKLRLYFVIQGILIIVTIALVIVGIAIFSTLIIKILQQTDFDAF